MKNRESRQPLTTLVHRLLLCLSLAAPTLSWATSVEECKQKMVQAINELLPTTNTEAEENVKYIFHNVNTASWATWYSHLENVCDTFAQKIHGLKTDTSSDNETQALKQAVADEEADWLVYLGKIFHRLEMLLETTVTKYLFDAAADGTLSVDDLKKIPPFLLGLLLGCPEMAIKPITDETGCNLLHCAAKGGSLELVQFHINNFLTREKDNNGKTILHYAFEGKSNDIVQYLISERGMDLWEEDCRKIPACLYATSQTHTTTVTQALNSVLPYLDRNSQIRLLKTAFNNNCQAAIDCIAQPVYNVNSDNEQRQLFQSAAESGSLPMMNHLTAQPQLSLNCFANNDYAQQWLFQSAARGGSAPMPMMNHLTAQPQLSLNCFANNHMAQRWLFQSAARGGSAPMMNYLNCTAFTQLLCQQQQ